MSLELAAAPSPSSPFSLYDLEKQRNLSGPPCSHLQDGVRVSASLGCVMRQGHDLHEAILLVYVSTQQRKVTIIIIIIMCPGQNT